jgi:hypothetical protein
MNTIVQQIADKCIEDIDQYINNTIHWQLDDEDIEAGDLNELELKVKQQILFTLIKKVTK